MPCNSDHMRANSCEIVMSQIQCIVDELDGKKVHPEWRDGYHPRVYCQGPSLLSVDTETAALCERLQSTDVSKLSLEAQLWWRDHLAADRQKAERQIANAKTAKARRIALAKLSPHERRLLGLKDDTK